jgi:hypothetical protein
MLCWRTCVWNMRGRRLFVTQQKSWLFIAREVIVGCETCNRLFADYKRSVHLFTDTVLYSRGVESDSMVGAKEADRLRQACDDARAAMMEHRRMEHNGGFPSKSGSS